MIKQTNHYADADSEGRSGGTSPAHLMSSGQAEDAEKNESLKATELKRTAIPATPPGLRTIEVRSLEAHVERRGKLTARIRAENPSRTEEEVEARLEQFGA